MSHFSSPITDTHGPIIEVEFALSAPRRRAMAAAGQDVPPPITARLLIDTGASMTSIDSDIVARLGLEARGWISMHTPSTGPKPVDAPTYDVELHIGGASKSAHVFSSMGVVGCDFSGQSIDGLFGRDALEHSRLIYSGPDDQWMLSF